LDLNPWPLSAFHRSDCPRIWLAIRAQIKSAGWRESVRHRFAESLAPELDFQVADVNRYLDPNMFALLRFLDSQNL
jgi:hypothetical protein